MLQFQLFLKLHKEGVEMFPVPNTQEIVHMHIHTDRVLVWDSLLHEATCFALQTFESWFQHRFLVWSCHTCGARLSPYKYLFIFQATPDIWCQMCPPVQFPHPVPIPTRAHSRRYNRRCEAQSERLVASLNQARSQFSTFFPFVDKPRNWGFPVSQPKLLQFRDLFLAGILQDCFGPRCTPRSLASKSTFWTWRPSARERNFCWVISCMTILLNFRTRSHHSVFAEICSVAKWRGSVSPDSWGSLVGQTCDISPLLLRVALSYGHQVATFQNGKISPLLFLVHPGVWPFRGVATWHFFSSGAALRGNCGRPSTSPARSMVRSQGGPLSGLPSTTLPITPLHRFESHLFRVLRTNFQPVSSHEG